MEEAKKFRYGAKDILSYFTDCCWKTAVKRAKRVGIILGRPPVLDVELYEERMRLLQLGLIDKNGNVIKKKKEKSYEDGN
jgi:hypothetical protein